jgi:hypothetical protein
MRIAGVCNKENGEWKMVQSHASIGIPNSEAFGYALPIWSACGLA